MKKIPVIGKINVPKCTHTKHFWIAFCILLGVDVITGILWYLLSWILPFIMAAVLFCVVYFDEIVEFFKGKTISRDLRDMAAIEHHVINGVMNTAPFWTTVCVP